MEQYIQFTTEDSATFLVEVDVEDVVSPGDLEKTGIVGETAGKAVAAAVKPFEQAFGNVLQYNVKALLGAIRNLPAENQPESMEATFGLKATGEVGNAAIAKGTSEANYTIKLTWKR